jgi:hypothetical protein
MDKSSIILGSIMIALFIGPFILVALNNKRKKKNKDPKEPQK